MTVKDRRPVMVDLWTSVPSYVLTINGIPRTVLATNKVQDLKIFLDFSIPIMNSTEQVQSALYVNSGDLMPISSTSQANRRFGFEVSSKVFVLYSLSCSLGASLVHFSLLRLCICFV